MRCVQRPTNRIYAIAAKPQAHSPLNLHRVCIQFTKCSAIYTASFSIFKSPSPCHSEHPNTARVSPVCGRSSTVNPKFCNNRNQSKILETTAPYRIPTKTAYFSRVFYFRLTCNNYHTKKPSSSSCPECRFFTTPFCERFGTSRILRIRNLIARYE